MTNNVIDLTNHDMGNTTSKYQVLLDDKPSSSKPHLSGNTLTQEKAGTKPALNKSVTITVEPVEEDQLMESADDILAR